jgi:hypothetical protein
MKMTKRLVLALAFAAALSFTGVAAQADHHEKNPCSAANPCEKKANPCDAKANPCAKKANPCDAKANPCAKKANPCDKKM